MAKQPLKVDWKKLLWSPRPNPWQDMTRLILMYGMLLAVWWHSWIAMLLITLAIIVDPFDLPAPKNPRHFIHRVKRGENLWLERTPPILKNLTRAGEVAIILGLLIAAWQNQLFQAVLLTVGLTSYKLYFMFYLSLLHDTQESVDKE